MLEPPMQAATDYSALGKPLGLAVGVIVSAGVMMYTYFLKMKPNLRQSYRDIELAKAHKLLEKHYERIQSEQDKIVYHAMSLEVHVKLLASSTREMKGTIDSLIDFIKPFVNPENEKFALAMINQLSKRGENADVQAIEATEAAQNEVNKIKERIQKHRINLEDESSSDYEEIEEGEEGEEGEGEREREGEGKKK